MTTTPIDGPLAVVGGGAWGTALAAHLRARGKAVRWWVREPEVAAAVREAGENRIFLPGAALPAGLAALHEIGEVVREAALVLFAVPSPYARAVYRQAAPHLPSDVPVVVATKGIEESSLTLPLDVAAGELGRDGRLALLSGPSFAAELARGLPTAVVVAARDAAVGAAVQATLSGGALRLYTNDDVAGVQLAGALKNVIAIASGVADGLGLGANAQAAIVTRGLVEISRLGARLGGRPATFSGLAGLGDLVLTCYGALSRNRRVGQLLGRGARLEDILGGSPSVPEGVRTTRAARALASREAVEMPIVEEVHRILGGEGSAADALARPMARPLTSEADAAAERR